MDRGRDGAYIWFTFIKVGGIPTFTNLAEFALEHFTVGQRVGSETDQLLVREQLMQAFQRQFG